MDDRGFESNGRPAAAARTRRCVLRSSLVGIASMAVAGSGLETEAARRGYSGPAESFGGAIVTVLDGELPGELRVDVARSAIGSELETRNHSSFLIEVDVELSGGTKDHTQLHPDETWWLQIGLHGSVRMSVSIPNNMPPGVPVRFVVRQ